MLAYAPLMAISLAVPLFMIGGWLRLPIGIVLIAVGIYTLYRRNQSGWPPLGSGSATSVAGKP